ncbi:MAG: lipopolysaccharide biosynthesis protein [Betaproteobacteria bacterium]|nr:lipopolysaccharide biosynthesis protein [Betaproteobacteria bacterium]
MHHGKEFNRALRWLAAGRLAAQTLSWAITILVIRLLTPADYGLAAMVSTVSTLITLVAEFGFGVALIQAREISREQSANVFGAAIVFGILSSLVMMALAPVAVTFYGEARLAHIVPVTAASFSIAALATLPDAQLRRELRFRALSFIDFISALTGGLTTLALAFQGKGVWALVYGPLAANTARVIVLHIIIPDRIMPRFQLRKAFQIIRFGGQITIARFATYLVTQSDILIAGRFLGKDAVGYYSVALDLAMLPLSKIMNIVNQAALPTLSKMDRETSDDQRPKLLDALRRVGYVIFPGIWGIAAVAPWLVPGFLGPKWASAILPLQIVCAILPIRMVSTLVSTAITSFGRADIELRNGLTAMFIFPLAFFAGVHFGVVGLAGAWCIALPLNLFITLFRSKKVLGFGHFEIGMALSRPAMYSGLMVILVYGTGQLFIADPLNRQAILFLVLEGAAIYIATLWFGDRKASLDLLTLFLPKFKGFQSKQA